MNVISFYLETVFQMSRSSLCNLLYLRKPFPARIWLNLYYRHERGALNNSFNFIRPESFYECQESCSSLYRLCFALLWGNGFLGHDTCLPLICSRIGQKANKPSMLTSPPNIVF